MKKYLLALITLAAQVSWAQIDIKEIPLTDIGKVKYVCETKKFNVPEVEQFFEILKLNSGAFAIDIHSASQDGKIWFMENLAAKKGQMVEIRSRTISVGRCPHCYGFKPKHLAFESSALQISKDHVSQKITLKMYDDTDSARELQMEATCEFVR